MIHTTRIIWRGITLDVGYHNSVEFDPVTIVPAEDGEEGPYCNNIVHQLNSRAITEISNIVRFSGISDIALRNKRASRVYEDNRKAFVQNVTKGALHELSTKQLP